MTEPRPRRIRGRGRVHPSPVVVAAGACMFQHPSRILLGYPQSDEREGKDMNVAQTQIRARITHVGSEYRKDVTSGTCEFCIADWVARSSPSASLRPSKPAPAPPKWSSASTALTSTTTGARRTSSSSPGASRVTLTEDEQSLVDARKAREGRSFLAKRCEERSEKTPKIDHPKAPARTRCLLR